MLRSVWSGFSRAFSGNYTPEGLKMTRRPFKLPENAFVLDPLPKRKLTICNLFANEHQSIQHIAGILEIGEGQVISALVEHDLIAERRRKAKRVKRDRRTALNRYHLSRTLLTGRKSDELYTLCGAKSDNFVATEFVLRYLVKESELCERCKGAYLRR